MFTGIVEEKGFIEALSDQQITLSARKVLQDTKLGDSIAVNGVCLTVSSFDSKSFTAAVMPQTWRCSNLKSLRRGDTVNLERAALVGSRIGGHYVQGHIDGVGIIQKIITEGNALIIEITAPANVMDYIVPKCFVAVDGVSLTEMTHTDSTFSVSLVGTTRNETRLGCLKVGDSVNLETDILGKYVKKSQDTSPLTSKISEQFLMENGF